MSQKYKKIFFFLKKNSNWKIQTVEPFIKTADVKRQRWKVIYLFFLKKNMFFFLKKIQIEMYTKLWTPHK